MPADHREQVRNRPPHTLRSWPLPVADSEVVEGFRARVRSAPPAERTELVETFHHQIRSRGTPVIELDEDAAVARFTFFWFGYAPYGVVLLLNRIADPLDVEDTLLEHIEQTNVHALTLRLPRHWQGSYSLAVLPRHVPAVLHNKVDASDREALARNTIADPLALEHLPSKPSMASAGQQPPALSLARGPEASHLSLWVDRAQPTQRLTDIVSPVNGAPLPLHRWSSPGATQASPVLLLCDGEVWRTQFPVASQMLDRQEKGRFPGVHVVFLESAGPQQRQRDYTANVALAGDLLEQIRAALDMTCTGPWIVAGQSLGGLFALLSALRFPDHIAAAVAQSPSLWWPSSVSVWQQPEAGWFSEQAAAESPGAPVVLECGALEAGLTQQTRSAAALLGARKALMSYREHPGGHDIVEWQASLVDALATAIESV